MASLELTADLDAFMAENGAQAWKWGVVDCCMALADWGIANNRPDLLSPYRGTYDDEVSCQAIVIGCGGLLPLISGECERIGFRCVKAPARGVIGIIGCAGKPLRQWGAIHDGGRWRVRTHGGFQAVTARAIGMWSI